MDFLKNSPKWTRQPKQVQISEDKVVITTERGTDLWARTYYGVVQRIRCTSSMQIKCA